MVSQDPPDHTRLRRLVSMACTVRRIDSLAPRSEQICRERLDSLAGKLATTGEADLITEYALPIPFTVICELLGIPSEDHGAARRPDRAEPVVRSAAGAQLAVPPESLRREPSLLFNQLEELLVRDGARTADRKE
jgi:cytochrome P450